MNQDLAPFVVIDGQDGMGKQTQTLATRERASQLGLNVITKEFPSYDKLSSVFVHLYLADRLTSAFQKPEAASLFYAINRLDEAEAIIQARQIGDLVLSDRFTGSNMAHQGTKFPKKTERHKFYEWVMDLEFDRLGIPRPSKNIVLLGDAATSLHNIERRKVQNTKVDNEHQRRFFVDIHETSEHLNRASETYRELTELYPDFFVAIECVANEQQRTTEDINNDVWKKITELL